jgi:hypothetical protein
VRIYARWAARLASSLASWPIRDTNGSASGTVPIPGDRQRIVPSDPIFAGELLSAQGLLLPTAAPGLGHLTNVYRIRLMLP